MTISLTIAVGIGIGALIFGIIVLMASEIKEFIRYKKFEDKMMIELAKVCMKHSIEIEDTPQLLDELLNGDVE